MSKRELSEKAKQELVEAAADVIKEKIEGWLATGEDDPEQALLDAFMDGVQWCATRMSTEGFLETL